MERGDVRGRRVLVTGAAGFVGSNVTRALVHLGARVHAIVRPTSQVWRIEDLLADLRVHCVDLADRDSLQAAVDEARPELVFHFAKHSGHPSSPALHEALTTNVLGTANLLHATARHEYRQFVHAGSWLEYGQSQEPLSESNLPAPCTIHGATKAAATILCQQFAREHRRSNVVLRLFSVYGHREAPARLIPSAIRAALEGVELLLTTPGCHHDWVFTEDVVDACLLASAAEGLTGEVINVGSGESSSNEAVVDAVQAVCGRPIRTRPDAYPQRPWDSPHCCADIRKAGRLLGWAPHHRLRDGIGRLASATPRREAAN